MMRVKQAALRLVLATAVTVPPIPAVTHLRLKINLNLWARRAENRTPFFYFILRYLSTASSIVSGVQRLLNLTSLPRSALMGVGGTVPVSSLN